MSSSVKIKSLEESMIAFLAANFVFSAEAPAEMQIFPVVGRNLFASDLPEDEDIVATSPDFNHDREPVVALYTEGGDARIPSSSRGGKMSWKLRVVLRIGSVPARALEILEELTEYLVNAQQPQPARGRMGPFIVKGIFYVSRPTVFARAGDGHAYAGALLSVMAVASPL